MPIDTLESEMVKCLLLMVERMFEVTILKTICRVLVAAPMMVWAAKVDVRSDETKEIVEDNYGPSGFCEKGYWGFEPVKEPGTHCHLIS